MPKVFVSEAVGRSRLVGAAAEPGTAVERQWRRLALLYRHSLGAAGCAVEDVLRPEIYQTDIARRVLGAGAGAWHLAVKPIEHLRPFHGLPNVFVCDWPYPEFSSSSHGVSPFHDQVGLLRAADAVVCCTDTVAGNLRRAGLGRIVVLPPHVPVPAAAMRAGPRPGFTVLTDADPDRLTGLVPLLTGFAAAQEQRGDLHLVVRMPHGAPGTAAARMLGPLAAHAAVSWVGGDAEPAADAVFVGGSGGSLPLVDALLSGMPVMTTSEDTVGGTTRLVEADPVAAGPEETPLAGHMRLTTTVPRVAAIRDAMLAVAAEDRAGAASLATRARADAAERFGMAAFRAGLVRLERLLGRCP